MLQDPPAVAQHPNQWDMPHKTTATTNHAFESYHLCYESPW